MTQISLNRTSWVAAVTVSFGRAPVLHQIPMTGSLRISKPPLSMKWSSGGYGLLCKSLHSDPYVHISAMRRWEE